MILFGVVNDASGVVIPIGGGGGPVPVGPWGPFVARTLAAMSLLTLSAFPDAGD